MRFLFLLVIGLSLVACGGTTESGSEESSSPSLESANYTLTPFAKSQEFSDASINLVSYKNGMWDFEVGGSTYELGVQTSDVESKGCANSAKGQHIHLIADNAPYAAKYEANFKHDIGDGNHAVLAFLSRSYHESIKTESAHTVRLVNIKDGHVRVIDHISDPMVFYSRPKGVYEGEDTKRVMLDYYMVNTNPDHYVQADINGDIFDLKDWQPYYIDGLPAGDNTIKLSLLDKDGALVVSHNNPVSRTFKLNPAPK